MWVRSRTVVLVIVEVEGEVACREDSKVRKGRVRRAGVVGVTLVEMGLVPRGLMGELVAGTRGVAEFAEIWREELGMEVAEAFEGLERWYGNWELILFVGESGDGSADGRRLWP
jgi:hypothetical protein